MQTISIIVPVFNESLCLPDLIARMQKLISPTVDVIFVDGGSTDNTLALIESAGLRAVKSPEGRAWQMNAGAAQTQGDILLFLHADTQLPVDALSRIASHLVHPICWGRFDVRIAGRARMLSVIAHMMNWRSRYSGIATGDQALFMTRVAFNTIGGFPEQALMEDIEASKQLKQLSRPACISSPVITSGRRWETRGVWSTIFLMWRLRWAYWRGQNANDLAKRYI
jgi:rSAM/selenodomain-associated transferase 2